MTAAANPELELQACFSPETVRAVGQYQRSLPRETYEVMSVGKDSRTLVVTAYFVDDSV